jgi:hypothetical protein
MTVDEKGKLVRLFIQGGSFTDAFDCTRNFHLLASFAIYVLKLCSVLHTGEQCCGWGYHWWEKVTYQYLKKMNIPCIILVLVINCSMKAPPEEDRGTARLLHDHIRKNEVRVCVYSEL